MDIELVEITDALGAAILEGPSRLSALTGLAVPTGWPMYLDIFSPPARADWPLFLFVDAAARAIVGSGGFLCVPDAEGRVQIGYEVAPPYRTRGVATAAMRQVLALRPRARVAALTEEPTGASASVLAKLGFVIVGTIEPSGAPRRYLWSNDAVAA